MRLLQVLCSFGLVSALPPATQSGTETTFLDHNGPIQGLMEKGFLADNIPFIDIPDQKIAQLYYYRLSSLTRHLKYISPGIGYIITEFVQPVYELRFWDSIDAAAGHHLDEARWLRTSTLFNGDYIRYWARGPGDSHEYTHWIQHGAVAAANATGDYQTLIDNLDGMERMWDLWDDVYNDTVGLYHFTPIFDAQEYSLPGYISEAASGHDDFDLRYQGPQTYRPSNNAYMAANAEAIAAVARRAGVSDTANTFASRSASIRKAMLQNLWNDTQKFFVDNIEAHFPAAGQTEGRQGVSLYPYRFGIGLDKEHMKPAYDQLYDADGFNATYWPTTLERRNKYFTAEKPNDVDCCFWQGQNWPFTTSHVLTSLAYMYRSPSSPVSAEKYVGSLSNFASTQFRDGQPWIAEEHYPDKDAWSQDAYNHSGFYQHSTFADNVITGLLGVIPRADDVFEVSPIIPDSWNYFALENLPYHGHLVTVLYDKSGSRYKAGRGLSIFIDGKKVHSGTGKRATVPMPAATVYVPEALNNIASNYRSIRDGSTWPRISASHSADNNDPRKLIDGLILYDDTPDNRWSNEGGGQARKNDTITLQLPRPRQISSISLSVIKDSAIDCPKAIVVTDVAGKELANAKDFKSGCQPNAVNHIFFSQNSTTDVIKVNLFGQTGKSVGLTELELWSAPNRGPKFFAVDAMNVANTDIVFDSSSSATPRGSVVALGKSDSQLLFSDIYMENTEDNKVLQLRYINRGRSAVTLSVLVNQRSVGTISLKPSKQYLVAKLPQSTYRKGNNYVTLVGGGQGLSVETIQV